MRNKHLYRFLKKQFGFKRTKIFTKYRYVSKMTNQQFYNLASIQIPDKYTKINLCLSDLAVQIGKLTTVFKQILEGMFEMGGIIRKDYSLKHKQEWAKNSANSANSAVEKTTNINYDQ